MRLSLLMLCAAAFAAAQTNDWLLVPGERVGPITVKTVRADLPRLFAPAPVENSELELDEGMLLPATLVSKGVPSESLAIIWDGKGADAHPKQIFLCRGRRRGPCKWHTANGITDGTRLTELETLNGRPFTTTGFGMNYGGNVQSWDGGKLEPLDCNGRLTLTLDGERERGGALTVELTTEERHSILGAVPISSTTPAFHKVNPSVTEMVFYFAGPDTKACPGK